MANITQVPVLHGTAYKAADITFAADAGAKALVGERQLLAVYNGSGSSITVTIPKVDDTIRVEDYGDLTLADKTFTVAAGAITLYKIPPKGYMDANGRASVNFSSTTDVTCANFEVK